MSAKEDLPQDALHPRDNLVGRRVGGLVQVDNTGADVGLEVTLQRRSTGRDRSEVTGANEHCKKGSKVSSPWSWTVFSLPRKKFHTYASRSS